MPLRGSQLPRDDSSSQAEKAASPTRRLKAKTSDVRIQNSEFRALHLKSEFCILTSDIFALPHPLTTRVQNSYNGSLTARHLGGVSCIQGRMQQEAHPHPGGAHR